jgi:Co/Zn/Cd efflux system component
MKRQTRIITLLVIDSVFFFVEIIVGIITFLFNSADDD